MVRVVALGARIAEEMVRGWSGMDKHGGPGRQRVLRVAGMTPSIIAERPDSPDASALIDELESHLASLYPRESRHGYSVEKLLREKVAFFVIRVGDVRAGCGGVQLFDTEYGELKRMWVRPQFRGQGLGKLILHHLATTPASGEFHCSGWKREYTRRKLLGCTRGLGSSASLPSAHTRKTRSASSTKSGSHERPRTR